MPSLAGLLLCQRVGLLSLGDPRARISCKDTSKLELHGKQAERIKPAYDKGLTMLLCE